MVKGGKVPYLPIDILRRGLDVTRLAVDAAILSDSSAQVPRRVALCTRASDLIGKRQTEKKEV